MQKIYPTDLGMVQIELGEVVSVLQLVYEHLTEECIGEKTQVFPQRVEMFASTLGAAIMCANRISDEIEYTLESESKNE